MIESPDELELLRQRYLKRLQADSVTADNAPQPELGMLLATGLLDVGNKANANSMSPIEIIAKRTPGSLAPHGGTTDNQSKYIQAVKDQQTRARQNALDDIKPISSIQGMIDAKNAKELAARTRSQDLGMKGYSVGSDNAISMTPGGVAEAELKHKNAQTAKEAATAEFYKSGKATAGKQGKDQSIALQQTQSLLESARGNPEVAQALKDRLAAKKFNSLINLNGDPNNLNPQMVQLGASEIAKIAQGGVPNSSELQHLTPHSVSGTLASTAQAFLNHPVPAKQGAFLKEYKKYADSLSKDANAVIKDKYTRILDSRKRTLHPLDYDSLNAGYLGQLDKAESAPVGGHPQDQEAIDWARLNPGPKADAILRANGL